MGSRIVECEDYSMYNMSVADFFGKSPKVNFICGHCGAASSGRFDVSGSAILRCKTCGGLNRIPVHME